MHPAQLLRQMQQSASSNNNNINRFNNFDNVYVAIIMAKGIVRVHLVHLMNVE